ncbi:sensor histidine kinase [Actinoplanes sp. NPDC020271]|uniref:sensor histidine kinase n=1 Tax=Actinoplanes sp. NPDC020271 TaxID=3363896 RepID=UPI003790C502
MTTTKVAALLRPSGTLAPVPRRGQIFDVLLALSLIAVAITAGGTTGKIHHSPIVQPHPAGPLFPPVEPHQSGWPLVLLLVVAPLIVRRRYPLATLWATMTIAPVVADYDAALRLSFYAGVIAAYTAVVYSPYRIPALASLGAAAVLYAGLKDGPPDIPPGFVPVLVLSALAVAADGLRRWKHRAGQHAQALHHAAAHERARIARELHDVVTHNVSMMTIQAGAARTVMPTSPDQAHQALLAVESAGRAALTELRHVMGLLAPSTDTPASDLVSTADSGTLAPAAPGELVPSAGTHTPSGGPIPPAADPGDLAPQPGLDRLEALINQVSTSGTPVTLTTTGHRRPVPAGIQLAAYRVVQEALTNTIRHAAGATADVQITYTCNQLRVTVTDTGGTPGPHDGSGHGLIGLRERLAVYGATLHTGPRLTGGYRVDAHIPLDTP